MGFRVTDTMTGRLGILLYTITTLYSIIFMSATFSMSLHAVHFQKRLILTCLSPDLSVRSGFAV